MRFVVQIFAVILLVQVAFLHASESADDHLIKLSKWLTSSGGELGNVKVENIDGKYRMIATDDIEPGERLLVIPLDNVFTPRAAQDLMHVNISGNSVSVLAMGLLRSLHDKSSSWHSFAELLPKAHATTVYYSESDMRELEGTSLYDVTLARREAIDREFADMYKILQSHPQMLGSALNKDSFSWALSSVLAFGIPVDVSSGGVAYVMLPFWNFFSHNNARTEIRFNDDTHSVEVYTQHPWAKGDEVYVSYGDLANDELLMTHGLLLLDNPYDNFNIVTNVSESIMRYANVSSGTLPLFVDGKISETLIRVLRMQMVPDDLLHRVNGSQPISLENELMALHSVTDVVNRQLARYKTSVEEDEALLKEDGLSDRMRASVIVRLGEKRLLHKARQQVLERWDNILLQGGILPPGQSAE